MLQRRYLLGEGAGVISHGDPAAQRQQELAGAQDPWAGSACRREPEASTRSIAIDSSRQISAAIEKPTIPNPQENQLMAKVMKYSPIVCSRCNQEAERTGPAQKMCKSCTEETMKERKTLWQQRFRAKKEGKAMPALLPVMPKAEPVPSVVRPVPVPVALPLDIVQVREGLCQISGRHGMIAQKALAADTALAQLQEALK